MVVNVTFAVFSVASKTRRTRTAGNRIGVLEATYTCIASFVATVRDGNITVSAHITSIANAAVIVHLIKTRPCLKTRKIMSVRSLLLRHWHSLEIITVYGIGRMYGTVAVCCVVFLIYMYQTSLTHVSPTISVRKYKKISLKLIRNSLITYYSATLVACETSYPTNFKGARSRYFRQFQHWSNCHRINLNIKITAQNYRRARTKHRKDKKGRG